MVYISRKAYFSAAHKLDNNVWSRKKNLSVYGKCSGKHPHGHNYELEIVLEGKPDRDTGILFDLNKLKNIIENKVIKKFDHQNLNELKLFRNIVPTGENICGIIWVVLDKNLPAGLLFEVKLKETEKNCFFLKRDHSKKG